MREIQKLLNKEIIKKKFNKDFILNNKELLTYEIKSKKYNSLLEKALHEGSDALFDLLLQNKIVDKENIFQLIHGFTDTHSERFMNLLPLVTLGESAVFLNVVHVNNKIPNDLVLLADKESFQENSYIKYENYGISMYTAEKKILSLRNLLQKILNDENKQAMRILGEKGINFNLLKSYPGLSTCKINLIEDYIHNTEIEKLKFMFNFGYTPVIQDLCYINGNKPNEDNLKLIDLYNKKNTINMDKPFNVIVESRPQYNEEIYVTLPAYLLDQNKQIRSSFLNELIKKSGSLFINDHFSLYHDKSIAKKTDLPKIFKFFNLDIDFHFPVDKKRNIFQMIERDFDIIAFDEKFWFNILKKLQKKNFDFNKPIYSKSKLNNNFLSYLINLNDKMSHYNYGKLHNILSYAVSELNINPDCYVDGNFYGPSRLRNNTQLLKDIFDTGKVNGSEFVFSIIKSDLNLAHRVYYGEQSYSPKETIEKLGVMNFITNKDFYEGINKFLDQKILLNAEPFLESLIKERIKFESILLKENTNSMNTKKIINRI